MRKPGPEGRSRRVGRNRPDVGPGSRWVAPTLPAGIGNGQEGFRSPRSPPDEQARIPRNRFFGSLRFSWRLLARRHPRKWPGRSSTAEDAENTARPSRNKDVGGDDHRRDRRGRRDGEEERGEVERGFFRPESSPAPRPGRNRPAPTPRAGVRRLCRQGRRHRLILPGFAPRRRTARHEARKFQKVLSPKKAWICVEKPASAGGDPSPCFCKAGPSC